MRTTPQPAVCTQLLEEAEHLCGCGQEELDRDRTASYPTLSSRHDSRLLEGEQAHQFSVSKLVVDPPRVWVYKAQRPRLFPLI